MGWTWSVPGSETWVFEQRHMSNCGRTLLVRTLARPSRHDCLLRCSTPYADTHYYSTQHQMPCRKERRYWLEYKKYRLDIQIFLYKLYHTVRKNTNKHSNNPFIDQQTTDYVQQLTEENGILECMSFLKHSCKASI